MISDDNSGVTVVIPTLNRGDYLVSCLEDLLAQEHRPLEILVVDQSNNTPSHVLKIAASYPDIISYHRVSFRGLPLARNYGWRNARYNAIVYIDDDVRFKPDLISEHLRALKLPNVGAVAGRISERGREVNSKIRAGQFNYWTATPLRAFAQRAEYDVDAVAGCNFSIWRCVAENVGGFDERMNVGAALYEETEFSLRVKKAGYRVFYNGYAELNHLVSPTGGCRVDQVKPYVWALSHNRMILIRRHTRWYQRPSAVAKLLRLVIAYSVHYRQPAIFVEAFQGIRAALMNSGS